MDSLNFLLWDPILTTESAFISQYKHIKGVTDTIFPYASDMLNARILTLTTIFISLHPIGTHIQILKAVKVAKPEHKNVQICLCHPCHTPVSVTFFFVSVHHQTSPHSQNPLCPRCPSQPSLPYPRGASEHLPEASSAYLVPASHVPAASHHLTPQILRQGTKDNSSHSLSCDWSIPVETTGYDHRCVTMSIAPTRNLRKVLVC